MPRCAILACVLAHAVAPMYTHTRAPTHNTHTQTFINSGPVTSCEAPEGAYAFFTASVVQPDCPRSLHPGAVKGGARCPMLASAAFDRALSLQRRLSVQAATVAAA